MLTHAARAAATQLNNSVAARARRALVRVTACLRDRSEVERADMGQQVGMLDITGLRGSSPCFPPIEATITKPEISLKLRKWAATSGDKLITDEIFSV